MQPPSPDEGKDSGIKGKKKRKRKGGKQQQRGGPEEQGLRPYPPSPVESALMGNSVGRMVLAVAYVQREMLR